MSSVRLTASSATESSHVRYLVSAVNAILSNVVATIMLYVEVWNNRVDQGLIAIRPEGPTSPGVGLSVRVRDSDRSGNCYSFLIRTSSHLPTRITPILSSLLACDNSYQRATIMISYDPSQQRCHRHGCSSRQTAAQTGGALILR